MPWDFDMKYLPKNRNRQNGAVLVMTLIFLVAISIIAAA